MAQTEQTPEQKAAADNALLNWAGLIAATVDETGGDSRLAELETKVLSYIKKDVVRRLLIERVQAAQVQDPRESDRDAIQKQWNEMFRETAKRRMERGSGANEDLLELVRQAKELLSNGRQGNSTDKSDTEVGTVGKEIVESNSVPVDV